MEIVRTIQQLRERLKNPPVAFVPTMGYLHDGHLSLIRAAAETKKLVVVSLFVNPKQFSQSSDLDTYPRNEERDASLAKEAGANFLFAPDLEEMYPPGFSTSVVVRGVSDKWEGEHRPGHFAGVATVVARLFGIVGPCTAFFGEKDWQQCCVVKRLVADLNVPVELVFLPTIRESDGLAMSSRNAKLSPQARSAAPQLHHVIQSLAQSIASRPELAESAKQELLESGFDSVDYVAAVNEDTLEEWHGVGRARIIAAATIGGVRLIDNVKV